MSDKKLHYIVIAAMAILHNGKRYEKGDKIELTAEEAARISLYVQLDEDEEKRQQAEAEAEKARLAAEEKARKAVEEKARKEAEKTAKERKEAGDA
ncbi:hypothetical protein E5343_07040 [Rodentibacter caecimuris]|uniref:DUF7210 family protein n=1 Tax=Rodentibacter caecimuris TaxID=1796644 RepID=UPI0010948A0A|nr:hypothetical protein [Pasteurella caecimuris]MCR1838665.1 hypothetical protein [Pasteurella caecimuris]MCU0108038.1 hypothetical protein [Pasteurella caecimuris]TGY49730.1 hypothetical protein E5343_07040 [Pasteurella caecimuris]